MKPTTDSEDDTAPAEDYRLDDQVGFIMRRTSQRHATIFSNHMVEGLTPTQFSTLARLFELGECSQNRLGRLVAMDAATTNGVVERLGRRGLVKTMPDPKDKRRLLVVLTRKGRETAKRAIARAVEITEETLLPLDAAERETFLALLRKLDT